ncbi:MAG: PAS domain S-box protein [Thermoplasmata archaeon]|nr:PAS domain S-box protein [Thermoplasmata archaeon]
MKNEKFLKEVTVAITEIASGNLSARLSITNTEGERDGIAAGINMLFEELEAMTKLQNAKTKALMNIMEDMEETKKILEESEEKYSALVESSGDGIIVIQEGELKFVNDATEHILGYKKHELIGKDFLDFIAPEYQGMVMKNYMDRIEGKEVPATYELELSHKNSGIMPIEITSALIEYEGEPASLVFIRDITERKKMESQMRTLSTQKNAILSSIPDIIMEVDENKIYTWSNDVGMEFFGDDVIGKEASYYFFGEQDTYDRIEPIIQGDENVMYIESWQLRRDGEPRLLAWWCKVVKDGNGVVTGIISTARDITEQKEAEKELKKSAEFTKTVIDNIPDQLIILDVNDLSIVGANQIFLDDYEMNINEVMGKHCYKLTHNLDSPCHEPNDTCPIHEMMKTGKPHTKEHVHFLNDGNEMIVEVSVSPIRNEDGEIIQAIHLMKDITERKKAEKELKDNENRLHTILENLQAGVVIIDVEDREIIEVNNMAANMMGATKYEIIGNRCNRFMCPAEDDMCPILDLEHRIDNSERVLLTKDGHEIPILKTVMPIVINGRDCLIESFVDISQQKHTEKILKEEKSELAQKNEDLELSLHNMLVNIEKRHESSPNDLAQEALPDEEGVVFLFPLDNERNAFEYLKRKAEQNIPVLGISRSPPARFQKKLGKDIDVVWLTSNHEPDMVCVAPTDVARLSMVITEFFKRAPEGVILLDGSEYIISHVGFPRYLNLVQFLNDKVSMLNGSMAVILDLETLDAKEARQVERECVPGYVSGG